MGIDGRSGKLDQWLGNGESHTAGVSWVGRSDGYRNVTVLVEVNTGALCGSIAGFTEEILFGAWVGRSDDMLAILPVAITIVSSSSAERCLSSPSASTTSSSAISAGSRSRCVPSRSVSSSTVGGSYRRAVGSIGSSVESRSGMSVGRSSIGERSLWYEFRSSSFEAEDKEKAAESARKFRRVHCG